MENLRNQDRQPTNATKPEKAEKKGQKAEKDKKRSQASDSGRDTQTEEDARVSTVLSRVSGSDVADIRSFRP